MNKATERSFQEWLKRYKASFDGAAWALELCRKAFAAGVNEARTRK